MANICELTDSYKLGHWDLFMPGTTGSYAYYESRVGAMFDETQFFGLQYIIKKYLEGVVVSRLKIEEAAEASADIHKNKNIFNRVMWEYILHRHDGRLPVVIKAVPEGLCVPTGNILMSVENTDKAPGTGLCALPNHLETLLCQLWYPCTVGSLSREVKLALAPWLDLSVDKEDMWIYDYMLHDFGMRGATCMEAAGLGGLAHLINFSGTDNMAALRMGRNYYGSDGNLGGSIIATEHTIMSAKGREGEADMVRHVLKKHLTGPISIVGDTYNIYNFCEKILGSELVEMVRGRGTDEAGRPGVVIVRPDSGMPVPVLLECLKILTKRFGAKLNKKGYRVLHPCVKVMWGDGLDRFAINSICKSLTDQKWSLSNIGTFGMGGGLLQKVNRDDQRFKFACSAQEREGKWYDIFKDPLDGNKVSKKGRHMLVYHGGRYCTVPTGTGIYPPHMNLLRPVFYNGHHLMAARINMEEVRAIAWPK